MTGRPYEQEMQDLFDAAGQVLEATYNDQEATQKAIDALNALRVRFEKTTQNLATHLMETIDASASSTAAKAADLLQKNFKEADQAASLAQQRYNRAARNVGWKMLGIAVLAQVITLGGTCWMVHLTIPPYAAIEARRQELVQLEQSVAVLERRGGRLQSSTCIDSRGHKHLCFRTNERTDVGAYDGHGASYRIPWGF